MRDFYKLKAREQTKQRNTSMHGYTYILFSDVLGCYKVGQTYNLEQRLYKLRTEPSRRYHANDWVLVRSYPYAIIEPYLHHLLDRYRHVDMTLKQGKSELFSFTENSLLMIDKWVRNYVYLLENDGIIDIVNKQEDMDMSTSPEQESLNEKVTKANDVMAGFKDPEVVGEDETKPTEQMNEADSVKNPGTVPSPREVAGE